MMKNIFIISCLCIGMTSSLFSMSEREKDELKKKKIELKEKKFMFEAACKFTSLKAEGSFFVSDPLSEASLEVISAIGQELQSYATKTISSKKNN